MLTVACVKCSRAVSVKELDEDSGFAVCRRCGAMFEIPSADLDEAREDLPGLESYGRISMPPSYHVSSTSLEPTVYRESHRRNFEMIWPLEDIGAHRSMNIFLSTLMWLGTYVMTTIPKKEELGIRITFFSMLAIPALITTYLLLISFINRTHLSITNGVLRVRHAPLPWAGNITLPVDDIQQLYCSRTKLGRQRTFYELVARLKSGNTCPVVSRLEHPATAMFLQQRVQEALGLG
ncbi:hypothetical protein [Sorangium sp. So ce131]|uniref:hypothetical protein n=1 Tax=Sorangium sp. So ce131 TaxID=3133282 RepID=UPI003F634769